MTNLLKNKWNNISDNDMALFRLVNDIATINNCSWFLIGARARDILMEYFAKPEAQRATLDTDIAICCKNWQEFYKFKSEFINRDNFVADDKHEHRIESNTYGFLDILPFGNIRGKSSNIKWPPGYDIEFGLIGFEDAYKNAMDININEITIKVTSPSGLALLKLLAWLSRKAQKDASDFAYIISNYFDLGNWDRLYVGIYFIRNSMPLCGIEPQTY